MSTETPVILTVKKWHFNSKKVALATQNTSIYKA